MDPQTLQSDVLIVGGGLAGSALAHALAQTGLSTVVVETRDPSELGQPSFDGRATALANGSQRILNSLGLWDEVSQDAEPIQTIHISERGRFGAARINARDEGVPALGFTLENRILGAALWSALSSARGFTSLAPAELLSLEIDDDGVTAVVGRDSSRVSVASKVVVAADGANSYVRKELGIGSHEDLYDQQAVILNCMTEIGHAGRAYERFTSDGPLAFLPLSGDRVAVVWTRAPEEAQRLLALDDDTFLRELQAGFGYRLGRITRVGARSAYPLARIRSEKVIARRAVLIGSAAVNLHPVAGQGFNLALRDVAALAEIFTESIDAEGDTLDPGATERLKRYQDWREQDQKTVSALTHGLIRLFGYGALPLSAARGIGLMAFDLLPGAKAELAKQTMGLSGRLSRLARGLPLTTAVRQRPTDRR
ncbi:MAG: 2-octaprenyl-6-methoxyphenyl hydroxylase [Candidatus Rariloculaceae bacterium]